MKKAALLLGGGALALYLASSKPKKSSPKLKEIDEDIMINEENINHYFTVPFFIKDIPGVYNKLPDFFKMKVNPEFPYEGDEKQWVESSEKAYVYLSPTTATKIWDLAIYYFTDNPSKWGLVKKDDFFSIQNKVGGVETPGTLDNLTAKILHDVMPDIYWKEGLMPYVYKSKFWYVWVSAKYLVSFAQALVAGDLGENWFNIPGDIQDDS